MRSKALISVGILLLFALHAVPILSSTLRRRLWPVLEWTMYKDALPAGELRVDVPRLTAITANGAEVRVEHSLAGTSRFVLSRLYLKPLLAGDSVSAQNLFLRLNRGRSDPFVLLLLHVTSYVVSDTGLETRVNPDREYRLVPTSKEAR